MRNAPTEILPVLGPLRGSVAANVIAQRLERLRALLNELERFDGNRQADGFCLIFEQARADLRDAIQTFETIRKRGFVVPEVGDGRHDTTLPSGAVPA